MPIVTTRPSFATLETSEAEKVKTQGAKEVETRIVGDSWLLYFLGYIPSDARKRS